jgi:prepilin-type N-terminal cleavage/methylation domain-containing protein
MDKDLFKNNKDLTLDRSRGFTLVELLVVIGIIAVISAIVFANYRQGERQFSLQRSSYSLVQDIRSAQNMAMGARSVGGTVPEGYGVYFNSSLPDQYILFADNGDGLYGAGDTDIDTLYLETGITITNLSTGGTLTVVFSPPDPRVSISGNEGITSASITINYDGGPAKIVSVNKVGLIEIQ